MAADLSAGKTRGAWKRLRRPKHLIRLRAAFSGRLGWVDTKRLWLSPPRSLSYEQGLFAARGEGERHYADRPRAGRIRNLPGPALIPRRYRPTAIAGLLTPGIAVMTVGYLAPLAIAL